MRPSADVGPCGEIATSRGGAINLLDAFTGSDEVNVHAVDAAWTSEAPTADYSENEKFSRKNREAL